MMSSEDGEGDLWDDSLLINAFNDAISEYKKMHNIGHKVSSSNAEKAISCKEDQSNLVDNSHDVERRAETNDESKIGSNTKTEMGDSGNNSAVKETSCLESEVPENHLNSSNVQNVPSFPPNSQSPEDYNQLLNKYYEIEYERQKILGQLSQFGYWNYNLDYGTAISEKHQTSASQAHPSLTGSLCPYGCQSWITPCSSQPSCCFDKACARNSCYAPAEAVCSKDSVSLGDTDIVKTAKAAAERALSSVKEQVSNNSYGCVNEGKEKQSETHSGDLAESANSETDVTVVLNAWYSAGFYTGKYLSEQSLAKTRRS